MQYPEHQDPYRAPSPLWPICQFWFRCQVHRLKALHNSRNNHHILLIPELPSLSCHTATQTDRYPSTFSRVPSGACTAADTYCDTLIKRHHNRSPSRRQYGRWNRIKPHLECQDEPIWVIIASMMMIPKQVPCRKFGHKWRDNAEAKVTANKFTAFNPLLGRSDYHRQPGRWNSKHGSPCSGLMLTIQLTVTTKRIIFIHIDR